MLVKQNDGHLWDRAIQPSTGEASFALLKWVFALVKQTKQTTLLLGYSVWSWKWPSFSKQLQFTSHSENGNCFWYLAMCSSKEVVCSLSLLWAPEMCGGGCGRGCGAQWDGRQHTGCLRCCRRPLEAQGRHIWACARPPRESLISDAPHGLLNNTVI